MAGFASFLVPLDLFISGKLLPRNYVQWTYLLHLGFSMDSTRVNPLERQPCWCCDNQ